MGDRKGHSVRSASTVTPFDDLYLTAADQVSVPEEVGLVGELLEAIKRRETQNKGSLVAKGGRFPKIDTELVKAAAEVIGNLAGKRRNLVESPLGAAIIVASYNFDQTKTGAETVLATLLHRFTDEPRIEEKILARLRMNRQSADEDRRKALSAAMEIARDAAKITITPRDFAMRKEVTEEDFENFRAAILAFPAKVAVVKSADAASGLTNLERAPFGEREARLVLGESYVKLAETLGWTRLALRMQDDIQSIRTPDAVKRLVASIEQLPGFKGLYSDPEVHKRLTYDLAADVREKLGKKLNRIYGADQVYVTARRKSLHGVAEKLVRRGVQYPGKLNDILALRIVIPNGKSREADRQACINVIDMLPKIGFDPVPGLYKNHIDKEKPYDSVHNVFRVKAAGGMKVEVQVRTLEMHVASEYHPEVSHLVYAAGGKSQGRNAQTHSDDDLRRVAEVRADLSSALQGLPPAPATRPEHIYCFDGYGRATKLPNIGPSIMDALINMQREGSDDISAASVAHVKYVYLNGKKLDMDDPAARGIEITNGDLLRIDFATLDAQRAIAPEWKVATRFGRDILLKELKKQEAHALPEPRTNTPPRHTHQRGPR